MSKKAVRSSARRGLELGGGSDPRLLVRAVRLASGVEQGRHRTGVRGSSTEFYDYRPYEAGDPLARVDWRLYGRTDRHYVRRFSHDARLTVTVVLDASASMDFRGLPGSREGVSKLELGVELGAATLALGARQGDRVGLLVADDAGGVVRRVGASPGRVGLVRAVAALGITTPCAPGARVDLDEDAPGTLAAALLHALDTGSSETRRGVIVLIGDAFEGIEALGRALAMASARGATVVLLRTLTPDEVEPGSKMVRTYVDPESGARVRAGACVRGALDDHARSIECVCRRTGTRCVVARTDRDPATTLRGAFGGGG